MNDDALNMQIRKCLKQFGVTSQQEIERSLGAALESGALKGNEKLPVRMTLEVDGLDISHTVSGELDLDAE
ncbi:DUF6494 family protein [Aquisalimonas asiatica]|uniref:Uncharacterized protein n=1 Tax=Aquisalimonas asiatica TaxID=406100 RepID=A0A1H8RKV6_9GAMM|nr:DUF6494 family protein [Aquisalimonas asiatica]SEO67040.1 hypothetical protein SAMN04488052_10293 [Aquisalimonas asiatica]